MLKAQQYSQDLFSVKAVISSAIVEVSSAQIDVEKVGKTK